MIVGRFVGKEALSAVGGGTGTLIQLLVGFFVGLSSGATVIISQYYGAKRAEMVGYAVHTSIAFSLVAGVGMLIVGVTAAPWALRAMSTPEDILGPSTTYIRIYFLGVIGNLIYNMGAGILRAVGDSKRPLYFLIASCLTNIVLDYIFIYPMQLGMTGAALATATAPLVGMRILSMHFWKKKNQFHLVKTRIHLKTAIDICRLGVSSLVAELSSGIVILVFNMLTLKFSGTTGLAAYSILANIALVLVAIFTGIGQGIQPIVSSHPGKNGVPVRHQVRRYALSTALLMAFIAYLVVFVFAVPIADLFNKDKNPLLTSMAAEGMRIYFVSLFFSGINMVSATYLSASDQPVPGFIISILRGLVLILPIAFLLAALFGMTGIWLCLPVTEAIVCIVTFFFLRKF